MARVKVICERCQVRPQSMSRAHIPHVVRPDSAAGAPGGAGAPRTTSASRAAVPAPRSTAPSAPATECPPNTTATTVSPDDALLRRLASSHYQSYTAALTVTIAVGCFLLLLNVLIFAGIYHQRGSSRPRRAKDDLGETGSCSTSSAENYEAKALNFEAHGFDVKGFGYECKAAYLTRAGSGSKFDLRAFSECGEPAFGEYSCYDEKNLAARHARRSLPDVSAPEPVRAECSGGSVVTIDTQRPDIQRLDDCTEAEMVGRTSTFCEPPKCQDSSTQVKFGPVPSVGNCSNSGDPCEDGTIESGSGAEESGSGSTAAAGGGILRAPPAPSTPAPPGIMKKRVQIQEISV